MFLRAVKHFYAPSLSAFVACESNKKPYDLSYFTYEHNNCAIVFKFK